MQATETMVKTVFEWKQSYHFPVAADVVGTEIQCITREKGGIKPPELVDAARPDDSPLHPLFEWDDTQAAEMYRQFQARQVINHIIVRVERGEEEPLVYRAFVNVMPQRDDGKAERLYVEADLVMAEPDLKRQFFDEMIDDIKALQRKYSAYQDLAGIVAQLGLLVEQTEQLRLLR